MQNKASILALSVWVMVFFAILGAAIFKIVSMQLRLSRALEGRTISCRFARAAYMEACARNKLDTTSYDTLAELGQKQEKEFGSVKLAYNLLDEESKININTSQPAVLKRLPGLNDEVLAARIFTSGLKPFVRKEEALLVEGVTEEKFSQFKDLITVHSSGKININTAAREALKVLGLDEDLTNIIITFRNGPDGQEATEDDEVFKDPGGILNKLRAFTILSGAQEASLLQAMSLLGTDSQNFSVEATTYIANKQAMKYSIVTDGNRIKQWSEY